MGGTVADRTAVGFLAVLAGPKCKTIRQLGAAGRTEIDHDKIFVEDATCACDRIRFEPMIKKFQGKSVHA